ncbi:protein-tyrosine phosphatase [Mucilaginibacter yixingensis]|uniref:protein-tyrosine-phosphatase n=1 Tax=Mucilaginibacter yixingensis TaxID=1295612 RepID=A0A2T5JDM4_9SPHI|nr:low molecular weight protein-tyrosine-phosphatase [Mucilaginibacter yixingensis]PTQ99864.1 protein-tyrosine phosphatase [Mucilaginibacter yixingensis]
MNILMVCLGNICRSPLAEGVMQHLVQQEGLDWTVDSAGTGGWHVGENPDHRSVRVAHSHGIDISTQTCRKFRVEDFDDFDLILVMDRYNYSDVQMLARTEAETAKIHLLLGEKEVPDPYYDNNMFEPVFKLIEGGCKGVIKKYR